MTNEEEVECPTCGNTYKKQIGENKPCPRCTITEKIAEQNLE